MEDSGLGRPLDSFVGDALHGNWLPSCLLLYVALVERVSPLSHLAVTTYGTDGMCFERCRSTPGRAQCCLVVGQGGDALGPWSWVMGGTACWAWRQMGLKTPLLTKWKCPGSEWMK